MYRARLEELRKEKDLPYKRWSEESGVSLDTITRIIHPEHPEKDSPRISTLKDLCRPLGVELWEIFYVGDKSVVALQTELTAFTAENENLNVENTNLKTENANLKSTIFLLEAQNEVLNIKIEHRNEIIEHKDKIIALLEDNSRLK